MKTTLTVVFMLCCSALISFADDAVANQFGSGGGPMPTLLFLDLEDLNGTITEAGYPQINQVMFGWGGSAYGGALDGIRVGGFGMSGDNNSSSASRQASLDLSYGGVMIEKATDASNDVTVVLGTLLGFGDLDLRLVSGLPSSFADAVNDPFISSLSKEFYAVQPYIAFESRPCSWMWARLQLGFLWTLAGDWEFEGAEFPGPPRTLGGFSAGLMIRFGKDTSQLSLDDVEAALDDMAEMLDEMDELEAPEMESDGSLDMDEEPESAND